MFPKTHFVLATATAANARKKLFLAAAASAAATKPKMFTAAVAAKDTFAIAAIACACS